MPFDDDDEEDNQIIKNQKTTDDKRKMLRKKKQSVILSSQLPLSEIESQICFNQREIQFGYKELQKIKRNEQKQKQEHLKDKKSNNSISDSSSPNFWSGTKKYSNDKIINNLDEIVTEYMNVRFFNFKLIRENSSYIKKQFRNLHKIDDYYDFSDFEEITQQ